MLKGIYLLILNTNKYLKLRLGALGEVEFQPGNYIYIGSAQNNLTKRVHRHLSREKIIRWHIDYITSDKNFQVSKIFFREADKNEECRFAGIVAGQGEAIKGFGSSDCRCRAHLFRIGSIQDLDLDGFDELKTKYDD